jgi:hypothetical protein
VPVLASVSPDGQDGAQAPFDCGVVPDGQHPPLLVVWPGAQQLPFANNVSPDGQVVHPPCAALNCEPGGQHPLFGDGSGVQPGLQQIWPFDVA